MHGRRLSEISEEAVLLSLGRSRRSHNTIQIPIQNCSKRRGLTRGHKLILPPIDFFATTTVVVVVAIVVNLVDINCVVDHKLRTLVLVNAHDK